MTGTFQKRLAVAGVVLLCLLLGWQARERGRVREEARRALVRPSMSKSAEPPTSPTRPLPSPTNPSNKWVSIAPIPVGQPGGWVDAKATNRLRNTADSAGHLVHNPHAILLRNAFIDTTNEVPLGVPSRLHQGDHPGAYVVQARDGLPTDLSEAVAAAGGRIISYIPNRAWLVSAEPAAAARLAEAPEVGAIVPYEPYFKLEPALVSQALDESRPSGHVTLILTIPEVDKAQAALASLSVQEIRRERGPFGALVTVDAPVAALADLARLPQVHLIETWRPTRWANDRTGVLLGVNSNAMNTGPYLGLTGKGVVVNLNDSGVDATHIDLSGRILTVPGATNALGGSLLTDPDGHGTHVAATIAGSGAGSSSLAAKAPQGSVSNANFQGKAPAAKIFILPADQSAGPALGDAYLQTTAASATVRTNRSEPLISNNSWGYLQYEYSSHSASFDAAVRDALPDEIGDQPMLYVFAAGNEGDGGENGLGGVEDSIRSPGNAKNVITVGALESARNLTNSVVQDTNGTILVYGSTVITPLDTNRTDYVTNQLFAAQTDTDYEVSSFSSRGNVGVGIEGDFGRFKPDVVAPGSFVISARSALWDLVNDIPTNNPVYYYLFKDLTNETGPYYRYESGTSMAAPAVSGLLALMQEFFHSSAHGPSPSAAGYKALLINGSSASSPSYSPDFTASLNPDGWGEPNLPRILQPGAAFPGAKGRSLYVIESDDASIPTPAGSPSNRLGLVTGEVRSYRLSLTALSALSPVRLTLVWTDPPGNPAGAAKLVNDLDLVVSNEVTGDIFVGNHFDPQSGLSGALAATNDFRTNADAIFDRVNNVERIILDPAGGSNFVVSVIGHLVNVNARRDATKEIIQDFALAISSDADTTNTISSVSLAAIAPVSALPGTGLPPVTPLTNGFPLLAERAGANSPLINGEIGQTNQWRFYVLTNTPGAHTAIGDFVITNGSNVAFVTFPVGELSRSRTNEPDIDLYVSLNPALTNLDPTAIAQAYKSTLQGATELVFFTNAPPTQTIYYIGVKSEDHEAAEYGFVGISTDLPFNSTINGVPTPLAVPLTPSIPDGTPKKPGKGLYLAISTQGRILKRVTAEVTLNHQRFADLLGNLKHSANFAVLNNHGLFNNLTSQTNPGTTVKYEDTRSTKYGATRHTDGPGSLLNFLGARSGGPWFLSEIDNVAGNTGRIANFRLGLVPNDFGEEYVSRCADPFSDESEVIRIPVDATELDITITNLTPQLSLEVYIKRDDLPDPTTPSTSDKYATIQSPGGTLSLTIHDVPPLVAGRYFVLVHNPNGVQVCYKIRGHVVRNLDSRLTKTYGFSNAPLTIPDQGRVFSSLSVPDNRPVTAVQVGLRIDHGRESDLAVRLSDPAGTSTVLVENRGTTDGSGFGGETVYTNGQFSHVALTFQRVSHQAQLFLNGKLVAQRIVPKYSPITTNAFYFRLDPAGKVGSTNATLTVDDFGLWGRVLPNDEIEDLYTDGLFGFGKQAGDASLGLRALWTFDQDGTDSVGTNQVVLLGTSHAVPGQIGTAIQFDSPNSFGRAAASPALDVGGLAGFTLEGWINVSSLPEFIAGWGNTNDSVQPALLANYPTPLGGGGGSVSAVLSEDFIHPANGIVLTSRGGLNVSGIRLTNTQYAVFSDNQETAWQYIKFAVPPFLSDDLTHLIVASDFETDSAGKHTTGQTVDGWTVNGQVTQLYTPGAAYNGLGFLSLDNLGISRTVTLTNGEFYSFSFATKSALGVTNGASQLEVLVGTNVIADVDLDVVWQTNVFHYFSSNSGPIQVTFQPSPAYHGSNAAVWLDSILILEAGAGHYLPEEPLQPHFGVNALGNWSLELRDTRGPVTGRLLDWQLTLTLAPTNPPAVRLTNGVPYQSTVAGDSTSFFIVEVPSEAMAVTNTLSSISGGPLRLLFNQNGLPDGTLPDDTVLLDNVTGTASNLLTTVTLPSLRPGRRFYLGVQNVNPADSNVFTLQTDFAIPIIRLTNGVAYNATNADLGLIDYYRFDVAANALAAQFSLSNAPSALNLVLSRGVPLPTRSSYQYISTNSVVYVGSNTFTGPPLIVVDSSDQPVPISGGAWYLGVYASGVYSPTPVPYSILAREITNAVALANGVPINDSLNGDVGYYVITIPNEALQAEFDLFNLTGSADLYVRKGNVPLPIVGRFDAASILSGTADRVIRLNTNSAPVSLTGGVWYVAVVPRGAGPVQFSLKASFSTVDTGFTDLIDSIPSYSTLDPNHTNDIYRFIAPTNTSGLIFEIYGLTGEAHLLAALGQFPSQSPSVLSNFQSGGLPEVLVLRTNSSLVDLVGNYFLEVRSAGLTNLQYTVRAATEKAGLLLSGQDSVATLTDLGPGGVPISLTINSVPGERYELEHLDVLPPDPVLNPWIPDPPATTATGTTLVLPLPAPTSSTLRFYRVVQLPHP